MRTPAYAARAARAALTPFTIDRREPGPHDVLIDIRFCGVCHSDIHQARDEWGEAVFPMVPGHEIAGVVSRVGSTVTRWKVGDLVGVGVFVDSCRSCEACRAGEEQYCERAVSWTYNSTEQDGRTPTYGGYSTRITVDEAYVVRMPAGLPLERAAPLLCAGITTYSPLRHFGVRAGDPIAIVGLGGLGHVAVRIAKAIGAHVTVLSHSPGKRDDARRLGADDFLATADGSVFERNRQRFTFILDTVSAAHAYDPYLELLKRDSVMALVGLPESSSPLGAPALINARRRLAGSNNGGIRETQEMLDFCAQHGVAADIELIPIQRINEAYDRTVRGDVRYRFVIDLASLT
ncbi:MAG TPA: NAD(P)-dependent alcohol dehydrogenase [Gemmatimonadales bacterium]|nr:NAD(P)-dependent alcohol dehydrogenase [Gemmatimonadales bacterium]